MRIGTTGGQSTQADRLFAFGATNIHQTISRHMTFAWHAIKPVLLIVVAIAALSCLRADRVTAPVQRARGGAADMLAGGSCGATCILFNNSGPLWSAITNPDSAAIPVSIADIRFAPAVGDSIVLQLSGDSALVGGINPAEVVDLSDGVSHRTLSLAALTLATAVWKFASTDTTTLHVTLNRTLAGVASGNIALTSTSSAAVVSAQLPWVAGSQSSSGVQLSRVRPRASHVLADVNPACGGHEREATIVDSAVAASSASSSYDWTSAGGGVLPRSVLASDLAIDANPATAAHSSLTCQMRFP